ncbi:MAG: FHA domain-containing serine/threonine-protein kinase [Planctomycetota bacterium]
MPVLVFENGPRQGETVPLGPGSSLVIGRAPASSLHVPDPQVANRHAQIKEHGGRYFVKDFANDSSVNDLMIQTAELKVGDVLQVGLTRIRLVAEEPPPRREPGLFPSESLTSTPPPLPPSQDGDERDENGAVRSLVGRTVGGYEILERIGRGGMGTVYRALQLSLNREVALKVLSPKLTRDVQFVDQFVREARAAGQLNHPHIVQVFDVGREGPLYFYSMEFMASGPISRRLEKDGPLPVKDALRIVTDAARALEYAELKHIVHRDIKPGNLMVTEMGHVKLADLGLARSLRDSAAREPEGILGTPHFLSPEQAQRKDVDIRSDIYSLGATLYMLLAGRPPFTGKTAREIILKQIREEPQPIRDIRPEIPERVADLVARMMHKDPAERPQTGATLVLELELLAHHRSRKAIMLMVAIVLLLMAGGSFAVLHYGTREPEVIIKETPTGVDPTLLRQARSQAEQLQFELEAREALTRLDPSLDSRGRSHALREFASKYAGTRAAEEASGEATAIEGELERERCEREEREQALALVLEGARSAATEAITAGDFVRAKLVVESAGMGSPFAEDPQLAEQRAALSRSIDQQLGERAAAIAAAIESSLAANDFDRAREQAAQMGALGRTGEAALSSEAMAVFAEVAGEATRRSEQVESARAQFRAANQAHDLRQVVEALRGINVAGRLRQLDVNDSAAKLATFLELVRTQSHRDYLMRWVRDLERVQALHRRLLTALEQGKLTSQQIQVPRDTRVGTIVGLADGGAGLRIEYAIPGGVAAQTVRWETFATGGGVTSLYLNHLDLDAAETLDLALTAMLVDEATWIGSLAPLIGAVQQYDAARGWGAAEWQGLAGLDLAAPSLDASVNLLERAREKGLDGPAGALQARLETERAALQRLSRALRPYLSESSEVGFVESSELLQELVTHYAGSAVVALAYDLLDDGSYSIPLVTEPP